MGNLSQNNPQGFTILITCSVFAGLAVIAVVLRLWSRKIRKAKLCLNDYAILVALVGTSVFRALDPDLTDIKVAVVDGTNGVFGGVYAP